MQLRHVWIFIGELAVVEGECSDKEYAEDLDLGEDGEADSGGLVGRYNVCGEVPGSGNASQGVESAG
jgi:hypothetical protein